MRFIGLTSPAAGEVYREECGEYTGQKLQSPDLSAQYIILTQKISIASAFL